MLGFSAREVSETLDTTVASVNSALQRARRTVSERLPGRSQQATLRALGDERMQEVVDAYLEAWARADVDSLRALLAEDAIFSMPPWPVWWRGREAIAGVAASSKGVCPETRTIATRANGQLAVASYGLDPDTGRYLATAVEVYTFEGALIKEITAFVTPGIIPRFGLPADLAP